MNSKIKGNLFALAGTFGAGLFPVLFMQTVREDTNSFFVVFLLFGCALLFNLLFTLALQLFGKRGSTLQVQGTSLQKVPKIRLAFFYLGIGSATIMGNLFYQFSLEWQNPVISQTGSRFEIILVVFLGWLIYREKVNFMFWAGAALVIFGFLIMELDFSSFEILNFSLVFFSVLTGACFGSAQLFAKFILKFHSPEILNTVRLFLSLCFLAFIPGVLEGFASLHTEVLIYGTLSAFCGPFLSRLMFVHSLKHIDISHSILFSALAPFCTGLLQYFFLGIPITGHELIGISIILTGLFLAIRGKVG